MIYVAGSMSNRSGVLEVSRRLRSAGHEVFNDWIMPGEEADAKWQEFEQAQGRTFLEALYAPHANNAFQFDKRHLDCADAFVLVLPCGKSGHLELGYVAGKGKPTYILLNGEPEKWDVMYLFAKLVCPSLDVLVDAVTEDCPTPLTEHIAAIADRAPPPCPDVDGDIWCAGAASIPCGCWESCKFAAGDLRPLADKYYCVRQEALKDIPMSGEDAPL